MHLSSRMPSELVKHLLFETVTKYLRKLNFNNFNKFCLLRR